MKGIILAGGSATRLYPITLAVSKQMLPVYDKPMIYYPLSTLMMAGIKEVLIISTPKHLPAFRDLLGDNMIYGSRIERILKAASNLKEGGIIFGYQVADPTSYGVVEIDQNGKAISIEEKPKQPKSNYAVTGLYFYDNTVCDIAKEVKPSARGELEITTVNETYLKQGKLTVEIMKSGFTWLDTGTHESLMDAGGYIATIQNRQGILIGSPEEAAFENNWIDENSLERLATNLSKTKYGQYLKSLIKSS